MLTIARLKAALAAATERAAEADRLTDELGK